MRFEFRPSAFILQFGIAAVVIALLVPTISIAAELRTVALTQQPAVGTPAGVAYSYFNPPTLNDSGRVAFSGTVAGSGVDAINSNVIWSEGQGSLALVARGGDQAPGTPAGVLFDFVGVPFLNEVGHSAFRSHLTGTGVVDSVNDFGIWRESSGTIEFIARRGEQAAGLPSGVNYNSIGLTAFNNSGRIALSASLTGPGVDGTNFGALWTAAPGSIDFVARIGDQAPDAPAGLTFTHFDQPEPRVLNDAGHTAFYAGLTGPGVTSANNQGIWSGAAGSLNMIAREGDQAVGLPSGVNFGTLSAPVINSTGHLAFAGALNGSGVNGTNGLGLWSGSPGSLSLVARAGSQAPGAPAGVNYNGFWSPVVSDQGEVAFHGFLTGAGVNSSNNLAIFSEGTGSLEMVARAGDAAPDAPPGVTFRSFGAPAINSRGQIAFSAEFSGASFPENKGIWATDATGQLQLIARAQDLLEVAPGDFRTISQLFLVENHGDADGRLSGFNNRGQIAFTASFVDGSYGVFVSNLVAVPEPGTLLMSGFLVAAALLPRGRRQFPTRQ